MNDLSLRPSFLTVEKLRPPDDKSLVSLVVPVLRSTNILQTGSVFSGLKVSLGWVGDDLNVTVHSLGKIEAPVKGAGYKIRFALELSTVGDETIPGVDLEHLRSMPDNGAFCGV